MALSKSMQKGIKIMYIKLHTKSGSLLILVPIIAIIFIALKIQSDEIYCTGGHTRAIFHFIVPLQRDDAEQ